MQVTTEEVRPRTLQMTIEAEVEQVAAAYDTAYSRAAQRTQVPGFRKGKAPRALLERYINEEAVRETAQEILVHDVVKKAMDDADIDPYDYPELESVDFELGKPATVKITIPLKPEVKLGEYKGIPAERKIIEITDEHVKEELENLQLRASKLEPIEPAEIKAGDMVKIELEMDLDSSPLPGESRTTVIEVGKNVPSVDEALIGAKPGDDVQAEIVYGPDDPDKHLAGKTAIAKMKIIDRMERKLPELNDEFAKEISEHQTLDELKADIRKRLEIVARDAAEQALRNELVEEIIKRSDAQFPEMMVEHDVSHDLHHMMEDLEKEKLTLEEYLAHEKKEMSQLREELAEKSRASIKGGLVLGELADVEKIVVTKEDLEAEFAMIAERYKVPAASVRARFKDEELRNMANTILQRKIVDFLVESAEIKEVKTKAEA